MAPEERKELIIKLYYEEHMRPVDIAPIIKRSQQYVSEIVKLDERYVKEKAYKDKISKEQSKKNKKEYDKKYWEKYVRKSKSKENREEYDALINKINHDNEILSTKTEMSDIDFAKWNRSIYENAKNSINLVLKKGINVTIDVPKIVRNVVHASSIRSSKVYV